MTQDPFLLNASIEENLRFAQPWASPAEIEQALELAQLTEKVASLPKALQTEVGERGYQFSGGERQRLSLARTIRAIHAFFCSTKRPARSTRKPRMLCPQRWQHGIIARWFR
ncbi:MULTISPECIES: ABC transporter ATP-binding protein [unclassified Rhizobium]|uniref:ATP-binding cassette domain-containing protein n=1 Tax=unclassified Rhizobium TaxID=2613769 RepID=UPI001AECBC1D|nr:MULTISPECIES: ABC transporter ATP-binding protein [unclassified Rhizobium]MDF0663650.1 ABC transporter ATP-binding protein [Rhizobium sp. BC49]